MLIICAFELIWFNIVVNFLIRQARKKFGLLEKHKDYVVRATAFHKKEQALQVNFAVFVLLYKELKDLEVRRKRRYGIS